MKKDKFLKIGFIGHAKHGKTTLSHAMLVQDLKKGGQVDLIPDAAMTQEGRDMIKILEKLTL